MQVQYVVGLCCLHRNPEAVEIIVGDLVLDTAAEKKRDVDITIKVEDEPGVVRAFKAVEVKREAAPLDVAAVEQLCAKFRDMPEITHPAIVSVSGYTDSAVKKAAAHKIQLYEVKRWERALGEQFPAFSGMGKPEHCLHFGRSLLVWMPGRRFHLVVPGGPSSFVYNGSTAVSDATGAEHSRFPTMNEYQDELMMRSTQILLRLEPASTVLSTSPPTVIMEPAPRTFSPSWPHTHTLDVQRDGVFLRLDEKLLPVEQVTISGHLQWQGEALLPEYHILERVPSGEVFAGAAVSVGINEDELLGLIFSPTSPMAGIHRIRLTERQKNAIRDLKLRYAET